MYFILIAIVWAHIKAKVLIANEKLVGFSQQKKLEEIVEKKVKQ